VSFSGSAQGGTAPYSYAWNFGDGSTAAGTLTPSHTYTNDGTYTVILTVTDANGQSTSDSTTATIAEGPLGVTVNGPAHTNPGNAILMTSTVTDPSGTTSGFNYAWSVTLNGSAVASGTTASLSFTPATTGTYVVALTATDSDGGSGTAQVSVLVDNNTPSPILLPPAVLSNLRQEAAANTPQWQAFKAQLDQNLNVVIEGGYQADELALIADYALGYQVLKSSDPTTAAAYADKAIAIMKSGLNDYQKGYWTSQQFLARGDGATTTFTLPNTNIVPSSVKVFLAPINVAAVVHGSLNGQDPVSYYAQFLKASNTPDGSADYAQGADWVHNPNLANNLIDWSPGGSEPAVGATYYVTWTTGLSDTPVYYTNYSVSGNTLTLSAAPGANQAVMVEYVYGTDSGNGSSLAYQQTSAGDGGFNSIFIDDGYTARYLGAYEAIGLDWLDGYVGLTPALKQQTESMLVRWSDYLAANGYHYAAPESNYGAGEYFSNVLTALALVNRDATDGPRLMDNVLSYRTNYVLPQLQGAGPSLAGGFWAEGWNYGALAAENVLMAGLALEESGQITAASAERHWATQAIDDIVSAQATPSTVYDGGDWYAFPAPFPGKQLFYVLGAVADDPAAQSYANYIIQNYSNGTNSANYEDLLFRNPSAPASFWSSLPLQDFAQGTGLLTARSDWGSTPTWVSLQMGNLLGADHQTYAPGMMEISRGADELLINGNAPSGNQSPSAKSTYSNTVVVDDGGAGTQTYPYAMGPWYGTPGVVVNAYEAAPSYVYLSGDYHAAYSPIAAPGSGGPTSELNRQMVYLRPDYVVVYDRVTTTQASFTKQLRWSFANAPTVSGNSFVEASGSSKLFGETFSTLPLTTTVAPFTDNNTTIEQVITQNATASASVRYVTAFQIAGGSTAAMDPTQHIVSTDGRMEGVMVGNQVVLFEYNGNVDTSTPVTYQITANGATSHRLTNLKAGQSYQVLVNGTVATTVTASSQGTISFTTSPTGAQTITIQQGS
jgi:PKD repeat protein